MTETYNDESDDAEREPRREPQDYVDELVGKFAGSEFARIVYPRELRALTVEIVALRAENTDLRAQLDER